MIEIKGIMVNRYFFIKENMMTTVKKFIVLILALLLAALGISLQMKAAIGLAPFDAMNQTLAFAFNMRVGDIVTIVQLFFVGVQILILKRDTTFSILLQIFVGALLGQFVNLFFYSVFGNLVLEGYLLRFIVFFIGNLWAPLFIGAVMVLDLVTMPVESFSLVVANRINRPFGLIRQICDIIFLVVSIVVTLALGLPLTIREGTIISALSFGPLVGFYMPYIEKLFLKWNIIEAKKN